jgi:hypothetical protein
MLVGSLWREPMLWFFVVGGALFALAPRERGTSDGEVRISRRSLASLEAAEARRRHVTTLPLEVARAIRQQAIDDELLYREGLRLGVDKNDNIIRQRVIEKMLFLADDLAGSARPIGDGELAQYLAAHADRYRRPTVVSFVHVFAASDAAPLQHLAPTLPPGTDGAAAEPPAVGDAFALGRRVVDEPLPIVEKSYGPSFAATLTTLPLGIWSAPVQSQYGFHLVKVLARRDGGLPALDDVRGELRLAMTQERKARATAELLRSIREQQDVTVDDGADAVPVAGAAPAALPEAD